MRIKLYKLYSAKKLTVILFILLNKVFGSRIPFSLIKVRINIIKAERHLHGNGWQVFVRKRGEKMKKSKAGKKILAVALCFCSVIAVLTAGLNVFVCSSADDFILTEDEAAALEGVDCILVLGCGVREDGSPSHMLEDRLRRGVALYDRAAAPKLLMSGDHGQEHYDEVTAMKTYALNAAVPEEDIFMDHAGFSTYESMYRAKEIFQAKKVIIITQKYHLYRAVYIARSLGLDAYGTDCDYRTYSGQFMRDVREVLARVKDFGMCVFTPEPTYLGEAIPVNGDGRVTNG